MNKPHIISIIRQGSDFIEWYCHECGRQIIDKFDPSDMIVINEGDTSAEHNGESGQMTISAEIKNVIKTSNDLADFINNLDLNWEDE